jgi:hypothetical protein
MMKGEVSRFRWGWIASVFIAIFGIAFLLTAMGIADLMAFAYHRYGLLPIRVETPSLNRVAITYPNVASVLAQLSVGVLLLLRSWSYPRRAANRARAAKR